MTEDSNVVEKLDLDEKVTVKSIAGWPTTFARRADGYGDVTISPGGSVRLSRNEIIAQVQNGNKLFSGVDGKGSHATLYIDDKVTRKEVEFETDDTEQVVFNESVIQGLFKKNLNTFKKNFVEVVKTRAEKYAAMNAIKNLGLNDYDKIRFVEDYTGFKR